MSSTFPFTMELPAESVRFYQGMMQQNNYQNNYMDNLKGEACGENVATYMPDASQGWTVSKGQSLPSPNSTSQDWTTPKNEELSPSNVPQSWTLAKGEELPPTPSTAGLGLQKLETSLSDALPASQSLLPIGSADEQSNTLFNDTSALPSATNEEFSFGDDALWTNQAFTNEDVCGEWNQLFNMQDGWFTGTA